ncbi:MAG: endonuclease III [Bacteroidia bacterium]
MKRKELFARVAEYFKEHNPEPETELTYDSPFQLLIAVMLSAQCTDSRVNMVTPALFEAFPTPDALAAAEPEDVFPFIRSISYPNNKSKHLVNMTRMLMNDFNGQIPATSEGLQKLPGVGRKTANVVASVVYDEPTMPVDTHVFRVANRIGLAKRAKTPRHVEDQLNKHVPETMRHNFHHWLILHGRYICKARRPLCQQCGLTDVCEYYLKTIKPGNQ